MRARLWGVALVWMSGCDAPPVSGSVVDGETGAPLRLLMDVRGEGCPNRVESGEDGRFLLPEACSGTLVSAEPDRLVVPTPMRPDVVVKVWPIPAADGVYLAENGGFTALTTHTVLEERRVRGLDLPVWLPLEIPDVLPRVSGAQELVLRGVELQIEPLIPGEAVVLDLGGTPQAVSAWFYAGAKVSPTAVEPVKVEVDPAHVRAGPDGGPTMVILGASAVPPGRYVLRAGQGNRVFLVDFGEAAPG